MKKTGKIILLFSSRGLWCLPSSLFQLLQKLGTEPLRSLKQDWKKRLKRCLHETCPKDCADEADDKDSHWVFCWTKGYDVVLLLLELLESFRTKRGAVGGRISVHRSFASFLLLRCLNLSWGDWQERRESRNIISMIMILSFSLVVGKNGNEWKETRKTKNKVKNDKIFFTKINIIIFSVAKHKCRTRRIKYGEL